MNAYLRAIIGLGVAFCLGACGQDKGADSKGETGNPVIFASLAPVAGILERMAGDEIEVNVLVGEGQDPHDFAVEAGQLAALGNAKALFLSGMPFEEALEERLADSKSGLAVIDLTGHEDEEGEHPEGEEENHEGEGEKENHEGEGHGGEEGEHAHNHAHAWLSPLDLHAMVEEAEEQLTALFPDKATTIEKNTKALLSDIDNLHEEIEKKMKPLEGRSFFTYHAAFDAFACAYDLEESAVEVEGKTPTPAELAEFLKKARDDGARALLVQPQFDTKSAEAVAKELDLEVISLDPMAKDALGNIRKIADTIESALTE